MPANTTNKNLQEPANGSFNNDWDVPVNSNWSIIDSALGGTTSIVVTGVAAGTYAFTSGQYTPPNIEFTGTIGGNLVYVLPSGVGGIWTVLNNTSGAFTISIGVSGGSSIVVIQALRSLIVSDGSAIALADTSAPAQAQANAEAFATAADAVVTTNTEAFATAADVVVLANAESFSKNASNLASGTVPNGVLPNIALMPGVTIQADPGGTPSGAPGSMFFYY